MNQNKALLGMLERIDSERCSIEEEMDSKLVDFQPEMVRYSLRTIEAYCELATALMKNPPKAITEKWVMDHFVNTDREMHEAILEEIFENDVLSLSC